jgi:WD40 repeat protein
MYFYSHGNNVVFLNAQVSNNFYGIVLIDYENSETIDTIQINSDICSSVTFSNDNKYIFYTVKEGENGIVLYDLENKKQVKRYQHPNPVKITEPVPFIECAIDESNYTLAGIAKNGLYVYNLIPTNVNEKDNFENLIYPNPAGSIVNIPLELPTAGIIKIEVTDITGHHIKTIELGYYNKGHQEFQVDISNLVAGNYFVKAICNNFSKTYMLIKD